MSCPFFTALSPIHGHGLFANRYFPVGTMLFKVSDKDGNITNLGKLVNHSLQPNVMLHEEDDGYYAVAILPIYNGREIVGNYYNSPDCIKKPDF